MTLSTPLVVFPSGHHGALGVVRSLGRLGVPVYCVDASRHEPAFASRYCRGRFVLELESIGQAGGIESLLKIGREIGGQPVLIPTTDPTAVWVAEHRQTLHEAFRLPEQSGTLLQTLCDKGRMQELADIHGIPTARSVVPRSKEDVLRFLESAQFPVMAKATDAARLRALTGGTKFLIHSRADLLAFWSKANDGLEPNFLVQEFIPGEDWMFNGYFDSDSRCRFGMTGKKIRRFPTQTGVTSLGVCLQNEFVQEITKSFMKAIGYRGILDIGYRHDQRDGLYKVLDVNPRIGCTFRLFASTAGLDVARALYFDLTGNPVPAAEPAEGRKWLVEDFDLSSAARSMLAGTLRPGDWIKSLRGIRETAFFALDDPLPALMMIPADLVELHKWLRGQIAARRKQASHPHQSSEPDHPFCSNRPMARETLGRSRADR